MEIPYEESPHPKFQPPSARGWQDTRSEEEDGFSDSMSEEEEEAPREGRRLRINLRAVAFGVLFALVLAGWLAYEWPSVWHQHARCSRSYDVHYDLSEHPICRDDPNRDRYEREGLLGCTTAEHHVYSEKYVGLCTFREWARVALPTTLTLRLYGWCQEMYSGATSWPVILLGVAVALFCFYTVVHYSFKLKKHAINNEENGRALKMIARLSERVAQAPRPYHAPQLGYSDWRAQQRRRRPHRTESNDDDAEATRTWHHTNPDPGYVSVD